MGNSSTKEQRSPSQGNLHTQRSHESTTTATPGDRGNASVYATRTGRGSRPDLSFLGIGSSSNNVEPPEVRRETKQEREARKLEKERVAREKERERSMREEHVDGGYLVTQGVYTGSEDFNKTVVRQLMVERRMAPFWRGLNDFKEDWTEHQLVAAAKGLPIPAADEIPPEDPERALSADSPRSSTPNLQNLMVPIAGRSQSYASDVSANLSASHPALSLPTSTSPINPPTQSSSPFRPRSKTLASLTSSSKNTPQAEIVPREVQLPRDRYVNGQAMEAFLYKDATECPICFIYYPPYLNKTRCCDQPICSECFVQIKRPEPHPPEHEHNDSSNPAPAPVPAAVEAEAETLVSEPANCPYCQQAEFGITFEPPPFRRGLIYANPGQGTPAGNAASAMSSTTSLNSLGSPTLAPVVVSRRRTTSISANASTVITTDRVRPDWATKLANARSHAARRSAAATALHTAAYLMGNGAGTDSRGFAFSSRSRFGRSRGDSPGGSGTATPAGGGPDAAARLAAYTTLAEHHATRTRERAAEAAQSGTSSRRRSRMDDLEDMMLMEAIRLSLAAEDERKRKEEKEAQKAFKKREKAEKKAEKAADKAAKKSMYSAGNSSASASGSALSLSLPGVGRRRGNSGSSALLKEAATNNAEKGKGVDRGNDSGGGPSSAPVPIDIDKSTSRQYLDTGVGGSFHAESSAPSPNTATAPDKPSHLRQMSTASSPASSFLESAQGSLRNGIHGSSSTLDSPNASGTHLGTPDRDADGGGAGTEPMFNFRSLAAMVGLEEENEKEKDGDSSHVEHLEKQSNGYQFLEVGESSADSSDKIDDMEQSVATLKVDLPNKGHGKPLNNLGEKPITPQLMITPVTPAPLTLKEEESKQLGGGMDFSRGDGQHATQ